MYYLLLICKSSVWGISFLKKDWHHTRVCLIQKQLIQEKKIMVLRKIKERVRNPLGLKVKINLTQKEQVIFRTLDSIFASKEGKAMISSCKNVFIELHSQKTVSVSSKLIDFTVPLHVFRKAHKPELKWIEEHINEFAGGNVDEFIRILKGDYQNIHIYFDTKNFGTVAFEGMRITFNKNADKKEITLGELRVKVAEQSFEHLQLIEDIRGYMLRTSEIILEIMKHKSY